MLPHPSNLDDVGQLHGPRIDLVLDRASPVVVAEQLGLESLGLEIGQPRFGRLRRDPSRVHEVTRHD
jgi:hypothetical protein